MQHYGIIQHGINPFYQNFHCVLMAQTIQNNNMVIDPYGLHQIYYGNQGMCFGMQSQPYRFTINNNFVTSGNYSLHYHPPSYNSTFQNSSNPPSSGFMQDDNHKAQSPV